MICTVSIVLLSTDNYIPEEPKLNVDSNANFPSYYEMHRPKDMSIIHCTY